MTNWVSILLRIISYDLKPHGMRKGKNSQYFLNLENCKKTKVAKGSEKLPREKPFSQN